MPQPAAPKIYHIVHVDRLPSIIADGVLWCDARIVGSALPGTTIGMNSLKQRRLTELRLASHPGLLVGECVPFYFCPRSVMLYVIYKRNHAELAYRGGQGPIVHLEADLRDSVAWANQNQRRWAFTLSNAASYYFEDRCDLTQLHEIDWAAVQTNRWQAVTEGKQAEFLVEQSFPWELVRRIGVSSHQVYQQVRSALEAAAHRPDVQILHSWYY